MTLPASEVIEVRMSLVIPIHETLIWVSLSPSRTLLLHFILPNVPFAINRLPRPPFRVYPSEPDLCLL